MVKNTNYYMLMEKQIEEYSTFKEKKKLLLHCCCAPCSSHCLEVLHQYFEITAYFYNPNITDYDEYIKRYHELSRFVKNVYTDKTVATFLEEHDSKSFLDMAEGMEHLPERGARCYECYKLRLDKSARYAKENGFDVFTTTLSISPHKNAAWLNEIGEELSDKYGITYLYSDFKKKNGYKRSIELSEQYGLYRQNFCGCEFSRR
ncbi:MAG: epoxyqueuosine reductase QueH [Coprococcus sp.]|nr:epoxyqueuosine reductase QueH [Coprococcus sp.]